MINKLSLVDRVVYSSTRLNHILLNKHNKEPLISIKNRITNHFISKQIFKTATQINEYAQYCMKHGWVFLDTVKNYDSRKTRSYQ